jgi:hypothetical protein
MKTAMPKTVLVAGGTGFSPRGSDKSCCGTATRSAPACAASTGKAAVRSLIATYAEAGGGPSFVHVMRLVRQFDRRTRSFVPSLGKRYAVTSAKPSALSHGSHDR